MAKTKLAESRTAVVVHPSDNVATALAPLAAGSRVEVDLGGGTVAVALRDDIPRGHKLALRGIARGERVVKYGETIGTASSRIAPGRHVHTHNVKSTRGRGDLARRGGLGAGGRRKTRSDPKRKGKT